MGGKERKEGGRKEERKGEREIEVGEIFDILRCIRPHIRVH